MDFSNWGDDGSTKLAYESSSNPSMSPRNGSLINNGVPNMWGSLIELATVLLAVFYENTDIDLSSFSSSSISSGFNT